MGGLNLKPSTLALCGFGVANDHRHQCLDDEVRSRWLDEWFNLFQIEESSVSSSIIRTQSVKSVAYAARATGKELVIDKNTCSGKPPLYDDSES
ncbi:hypothetical protein EVAR_17515_1 [Eumeta japonica]|uniref:Uncharacterized protein n=1 Tax=Eumeta variegata TaxID=151549 RepID=A0A4C1WRG3_EUMVA|nr:hypothetical protein EVAR_17515_1 [Eumeta japonica]